MGGVGMLGGPGLELPYPWIMRNCITIHGQWMYPPEATVRLVGLIRSGLLDLHHFDVTAFDLDDANEAVAHAAANASPFKMTVIRPSAVNWTEISFCSDVSGSIGCSSVKVLPLTVARTGALSSA